MRILLQRVTEADVHVDGAPIGRIGAGVVALAGVENGDGVADVTWLAGKIAGLRIFPGESGHFDHSLLDTAGQVLLVSQFTLHADTRKGRRPSFARAAPPDEAEPLIDRLAQELRDLGLHVETGRFGAMMDVHLTNSGPVTIMIDSRDRDRPRRETGESG